MRYFVIILACLFCSPIWADGQPEPENPVLDSLIREIMIEVNSLVEVNAKNEERINILNNMVSNLTQQTNIDGSTPGMVQVVNLSDSTGHLAKQNDPNGITSRLIQIFNILIAVCTILVAVAVFVSKWQYSNAKEVIREAKEQLEESRNVIELAKNSIDEADKELETVRDQMKKVEDKSKSIVSGSRNYAEYFLVFMNDFLPEGKKLDAKYMKDVLDLANFDPDERFVAIGNLKALGDKSVIPYLEWVTTNRPSSKKDAIGAIEEILRREDQKESS